MASFNLPNGLTPEKYAFVKALFRLTRRALVKNIEDANALYGSQKTRSSKATLVKAWKESHPDSKANPKNMRTMASRMWADVNVRSTFEQMMQDQDKLEAERLADVAEKAKRRIIMLCLNVIDSYPELFYDIDPETGARKNIPIAEFSDHAWDCIDQIGRGGFSMVPKATVIKILCDLLGLNAAQEVNVTNRGSMSGEIRIGFDDSDE